MVRTHVNRDGSLVKNVQRYEFIPAPTSGSTQQSIPAALCGGGLDGLIQCFWTPVLRYSVPSNPACIYVINIGLKVVFIIFYRRCDVFSLAKVEADAALCPFKRQPQMYTEALSFFHTVDL